MKDGDQHYGDRRRHQGSRQNQDKSHRRGQGVPEDDERAQRAPCGKVSQHKEAGQRVLLHRLDIRDCAGLEDRIDM